MVMLHWQRVGADTVGSAINAKETIGTITIPSNATNVYGILAQRGSTATTAQDEACIGEFFVNPRSIGIQEFNFPGNGTGGGAATNEAGVYDPGTFVPFRNLANPANEQVTFTYNAPVTMTQEDYAQCFLLTSNGALPDTSVLNQRGDSLDALFKYVDWSETAWDLDIYDSTSEVMAETISVPGSVGLIHAVMISVYTTDNLTAGEHFAGYATFTGTIPNLSPMDVPIPLIGASLGTHVDWCPGMKNYVYPMYIPMTGKNETLTITINLAATCTAEFVVGVTLFGTKR